MFTNNMPDVANGNSALTAGRWKQQTKQELARKYPKGTFKDLGKGRFVILPIYKPGGKKIAEPQVLAAKPLGACLYCRNVRNMLSVIVCLLCYDGDCDHADHVVRTLESVNNPVKTGPAFLQTPSTLACAALVSLFSQACYHTTP